MTAKFLNLALYEKENYRDFPSTKPVLSEAEMLRAGISRIAAINQCIMLKFIWPSVVEARNLSTELQTPNCLSSFTSPLASVIAKTLPQ